jgi:hypothetical protein
VTNIVDGKRDTKTVTTKKFPDGTVERKEVIDEG